MKKNITILGSTGSIGQSALDVIARHLDLFQVEALTARSDVTTLFSQCLQFHPHYAAMLEESSAHELRTRLKEAGSKTEVLSGEKAICELSADSASEIVLAAIVGGAGLKPTLSAVKSGKRILLANKEPLVMAGELFMQSVAKYGATLIAVDSEHNAVTQCLPNHYRAGDTLSPTVNSIILTASGGPFRDFTLAQMENITPEQAVQHPNWVMGKKISVDSATMMNKGLEVIEAHFLFQLPLEKISVLIHPQSIVHALVRYCDGSTIAQMSYPDMRVPLSNALAHPHRIASGVQDLDLSELSKLEFRPIDFSRYPCLTLAYEAIKSGNSAMCALNAANEVAVSQFLERKIQYQQIPKIIEHVLNSTEHKILNTLEEIIELDERAAKLATSFATKQPVSSYSSRDRAASPSL
jgi:1-deoxy-D-xylulose-5-phosphate reductoisomerase